MIFLVRALRIATFQGPFSLVCSGTLFFDTFQRSKKSPKMLSGIFWSRPLIFFITITQKYSIGNGNTKKNGGAEYEKSMFLHGIKGITSDYELVMHHRSSRKHGIQGYLIMMGCQNLPISMKKSQKSQKSWIFSPITWCTMVVHV